METECTPKPLEFERVGKRQLVATFDAEHICSDEGLVLLHRTDRRFGLMRKFAACFRDLRAPDLIHHTVEELVRQRVFAFACGSEDLVDHATLRQDPLLAAVVGKSDPAQQLASPSTLKRLEVTPEDATADARYRKVVYAAQAVEAFFVEEHQEGTLAMTLEGLAEEFARNVASQTDAIWKGDARTGNKHARRYIAAFKKLREHGAAGMDALAVLFTHPRMDVRVKAAIYLLSARPESARPVLEEAARSEGMIPFEASQALKSWNEGTWTLDVE